MNDLDLTYFFKTKAQAADFAARLSTISGNIFENDFHLEKALLEEFGIQKTDKFMALLRDNKITIEKTADLKNFLNKILATIQALPVLTLTIAFEPKEKTLQALSEWFVMNIKKQMLFEITVDPNLVAGATINYKGKFIDVSIKPVFDTMLKDILSPSEQAKQPSQENQQPVQNSNPTN